MVARIMIAVALLILAAVASLADGVRRKSDPPPRQPKSPMEVSIDSVKSLEGYTNWGILSIDGRTFTLEDHPTWRADGYIREDGGIVIMWVLRSSMTLAPGVYRPTEGTLEGVWGHAEESRIVDGKLEGAQRPDTIRRVPPPEPDL